MLYLLHPCSRAPSSGILVRNAGWVESQAEFPAQIDFAYLVIDEYGFRFSLCQNLAVIENVGVVANAEGFPDVMVGNQDANVALAQVFNNALYVNDGYRVDTGKRLIQQNKSWIGSQCPGGWPFDTS